MKDIGTLKNRVKLRRKSRYSPRLKNDTRWSSEYDMLLRYEKLDPILSQCNFDETTVDKFLENREKKKVKSMLQHLKVFQDVSLELQKDDYTVNMAFVRRLFDDYPVMAHHLAADANIVFDKVFESAVVKIQSHKEEFLSDEEAAAVEQFLINEPVTDSQDASLNKHGKRSTYVQHARAEQASIKRAKLDVPSKYRPLHHLSVTSNVVERLFSTAKIIMSDRRKSMEPYHLELLLFLRTNRELWNAKSIDYILANPNEFKVCELDDHETSPVNDEGEYCDEIGENDDA